MNPETTKSIPVKCPKVKNLSGSLFFIAQLAKDWAYRTILAVALLVAFSATTEACEVHFSVSGEQKTTYQPGDTFILEVKIVYTHRECEIQLSDTKFLFKGIKILGATNWKEMSPTTFVRQIKIQVTDEQVDEAGLSLARKCSKEGVIGKFTINKG